MDGLQSVADEPFKVAVPACKCEMPDDLSLMLYESHVSAKSEAKKSGLERALGEFESLVAKQDSSEERKAIEKDLDSLNQFFASLSRAESAVENAVRNSPESLGPEQAEKMQALVSKSLNIKRRLAASIRSEQRKV